MKKITLLLICIAVIPLALHAQKMSLRRAVQFYKSNNLEQAEKEISLAIQPPFSSVEEWSKTLNYYFLIKADLYCSVESLASNLHELTSLITIYSQSKKTNENGPYLRTLTTRMEFISNLVLDMANLEYKAKNYDAYLTIMDFHVLLSEVLEKNVGQDYAQIADASAKAGHSTRAIFYWKKMVSSGYKIENAYKDMLSMLYAQRKYNEVDELLVEAKGVLPESSVFAEVEILRLMDRDLLFGAKTLAQKTLEKDPSNLEIVFLLGILNTKFKDYEGALDSFLEVAQNDDEHYDTHLELGKHFWSTRREEGNLSLAKHYLEKAENINPNDTAMLDLLKNTYYELNDITNYARITLKMGSL